jgi:hypothetical protein
VRRRLRLALVAAGVLLFASMTPSVIATAQAPPGVGYSGSESTGLSIASLLGILVPVAGAWASTVIYLARSKDDALKGQADAHRTERSEREQSHRIERDGLHKMLERERERVERLAAELAAVSTNATQAVGEISKTAMDVVDGFRRDVANAYVTPESPSPAPQRDSRTSVPGPAPALPAAVGPVTRRGQRRNDG